MKRAFLVVAMVSATLVGGAASAQGDQALLHKALVLGLAEDLGLDAAQTVRFYAAYNDYAAQAAALDGTRAEAADLNKLAELDKQLLDLRVKGAERMSAGLPGDPKTKVYEFLGELPVLAAAAWSPAPASCPMAAAAMAEAAAPASAASDEELIKTTVASLKKALEDLDLDALLATFSDNFHHREVGGKEEAKYMLQMGIDMGYADDGEVFVDDMEIEIDGDEATVYPIELSSPAGAISVELVLAKEGDKWLITTLNPDGL